MNQHRPVSAGYDDDFYAWTQQQAEHLRRLEAAGIDLPVALDLAHLAEEVQDLGKSDLRGATSLIRNIMVHLIKATSDPDSEAVGQEAATFHADLPGFYTPSMRRLIDVQALWKRALGLADLALRKHGRQVGSFVPAQCPYSLDDFLGEHLDIGAAIARMRPLST